MRSSSHGEAEWMAKRGSDQKQKDDDARSRMEAGGEVQWMVAPEACGTCGTVTLTVKATRRGASVCERERAVRGTEEAVPKRVAAQWCAPRPRPGVREVGWRAWRAPVLKNIVCE